MKDYTRRPYKKHLKDYAKVNRKNPTPAEELFRENILRDKKTGYKFLRQKPLDNFIMDFYCPKLRLCIEIDGGYHQDLYQKDYDEVREDILKTYNIQIIRFTNDQVLGDLKILKKIINKYFLS